MYGALQDALTASIASSFDPNVAIMRQLMQSSVDTQQTTLVDAKGESIERLEKRITDAKERNADQSVIAAYQKLLAKLTA